MSAIQPYAPSPSQGDLLPFIPPEDIQKPVSALIQLISSPKFKLLQKIGVTFWGIKEMAYEHTHSKPLITIQRGNTLCSKISAFVHRYFFILHGAFFFGSGLTGAFTMMDQMGILKIGKAYVPFKIIDNALFLLANCVGLAYFVKLYWAATHLPSTATPKEVADAKIVKTSAVIGILNSLSYLIWGLLFLGGVDHVISLVFCGVAMLTSCIKVLYDYFSQRKANATSLPKKN